MYSNGRLCCLCINVFVVESVEVNPFSLVGFDRVLITESAVKQLEERVK